MSLPTKNHSLEVLGALCLFLSILEYLIPKPIPFIRLGLANAPILISLIILTPKNVLKLVLIKSIGGSLVTGTLFSWIFLYSLSGSLLAGVVMMLTYKILKQHVSMVGISVIGALFNNLAQISIATIYLGHGAIYLGIPILISGLITGIVIGIFSNRFIKESKWVAKQIG